MTLSFLASELAPVDTCNRATVDCLLNLPLAGTGRVVSLGDAVVVQPEYLGNDAHAEPAPDANLLIDENLSCHDNLLASGDNIE
jgi:hypothetical protein